jgi:hypothetical protein
MLTTDGESLILSAKSKSGQAAIGQILFEQNALSLAAAHGEGAPETREAFGLAEAYRPSRYPIGLIDPVAVVDAVAEYEKQASVGDAWEMSLAAWITARIMSQAARALAGAAHQRVQT